MQNTHVNNESIAAFFLLMRDTLPNLNLDVPFLGIHSLEDYTLKYKNFNKIMFVGSNPSESSPNNTPFQETTKSYKFIQDKWLKDVDKNNLYITYKNLSDDKIEGNKPLKKSDIKVDKIREMIADRYTDFKIVACGKTATMGLSMVGVDFFEMPHPSGLCRFWNDKEAGEAKIKEMRRWLGI